MIDLDRLQTWLNQSNLQTTNNPLFQVILNLIKATRELQNESEAGIADNAAAITGLENLDFITHSDEAATLPNSRQLVAGTGITFDDTVVNQRIINSSGSFYDAPLSDGDLDEADLIFAAGECIIVQVPI